ncbi:uncharacterized protein [Amphiura filiformis]|uniref:uncharacterized protein n=1 Tax=Amphiura filiformis TaxID=82378 RepID=UPI003B213187
MDLQKFDRHLSLNKILFITIVCVSMVMEVLSDACNTPCSCEMETEGLVVNCAARELTAVPADIPKETVILRLSDNSISSVSVEDFKYLGSLQRLYLDGNSLRSDMISVGAFQNLENLEYLDLSDNRIRPETSHMTALLQPLTSLIWLDLSDNNIPMITQGMITIFDRLQTLTLTGNALACNCDILWLKNWLLNTRFAPPIVNGAECYSPSSLRRQQVAYAQFCPGAGRCYQCNDAASNEDCTSIQDCSADQDACQNVIRTSNGVKRISKGCQQLQACLNNNGGNLDNCNTDQPDSACWHCCQGDLCNMPETAVVIDGCRVYQTPNQYVYRYPWPRVPNTVTAVTFKLRANNDGHIALSDERVDKDELIEIVLGGWKNNKSVIRSCKQCSPLAEASTPDLLMSPTEDKHFYVTFEGSVINVGIVGMAPILTHQFDEEPTINFIGISTGWGSTGQWTFCGYDTNWAPLPTPIPLPAIPLEDKVEDGAIRLAGNLNSTQGHVEIFHRGQWGRICGSTKWNIQSASVVCRQLGLEKAIAAYASADQNSGSIKSPQSLVWLDDVTCIGNEERITTCKHRGLKYQECRKSQYAYVICDSGQDPIGKKRKRSKRESITACPAGWNTHGDYCYYVSSEAVTFGDAQTACLGMNAMLTSIHDQDEQEFLSDLVAAGNGQKWIGLNDIDVEGTFTWIDGTPLDFEFWAIYQPDNDQGMEDCVHLKNGGSNTGLWNDIPCSDTYKYICKKSQANPEPSPSPSGPDQPQSPVPEGQCAGKENGLYPDPEDCMKFYACSDNGQSEFHISCDTNLVFNPYCKCCDWPQNYDCNGVSDFSCLGRDDGLYPADVDNCAAYFTCSDGQITGRTFCADGTIFNPETQWCSWPADYQCPLPTTSTSMTNAEMDNYVCEHDTFHIECAVGQTISISSALYGRQKSDVCTERSVYVDCAAENSLTIVQEQCEGLRTCDILASNGVFGDPCPGTFKYLEIEYLCEDIPTCHEGWSEFNNECYLFQHSDEYVSYVDAKTQCSLLDAQLAVIHSQEEQDFIAANLHEDPNNELHSYYIGLDDIEIEGQFQWVDGTPLDFTDWKQGEPNNIGSGEDCVGLWASRGGIWNDNPCTRLNPYICEKPLGPILTPGTTSAPMVSVTGTIPVIPEVCYEEVSNEGDKGKISWPETTPEVTSKVKCPYQTAVGDTTYARRTCAWLDTSGAYWMDADVDECPTDTEILEELADEEITEDNAEEVSDMLAVVTSNPDSLNDNDVNNAVITIEHLSDSIDTLNPTTNTDILTNVLTTVNNMVDVPIIELEASQREENTSSRILKTVDEFALRVQFTDTSIIQNTQAVDMAVAKIDNTNLNTDVLFRSVGTKDTNYQPELYLNFSLTGFNIADDDGILQASILLPNSLLQTVADDIDRCQFNLFQDTTFFEVIDVGGPTSNSQDQACNPSTSDDSLQATDCESPNEEDNQQDGDNEDIITILNSVVISGSIGDLEVNDLDEPAIIKLRNINEDAFNPRCVFWDVNMKNGKGGWSEKGCRVNEEESSKSLTVCECDHLTNFAMIMDVYKDGSQLSRGHTIALSVISYIGCAVSFIALLLTLLTYTMCGRDKKKGKRRDRRSGRRDKRTKILLNLVVALLLVNLFFICGALVADYSGSGPLCVAMAVILHYFLLSAMMWMALEAFDMYMALVKVFESYYSHYLLKMCIAGWGLPIIAIAFTAGFDINNYGYHSGLCWLSTIPFYAAFLAPVCLILLFNSIVFIMVTKQLCDMRKRKITKSDSFDLAAQLRASFSITFLLGLTWILAIFAVGSADLTFSYLFAIFNSLQGFSLFFFQCVLNPDIRKRWFRVCCPKCAPPEDDPYPSNDATTRRITQQQKISTSSMSPLAVSSRISQFENGHYDNNSNGHTYDNSRNGHTYDNSSNTYHPTSYTDNTYDNAGPYDPDYEAIQPMPLPPRTTTT